MSRQQQQEVMWLCSLSTPGWPGCWNSAGTSGDGKNVPQNRTNQPSILLCLCRNSSSSSFVNGTLVRYRRPVLRQLPRAIPFGCFLSFFSYFLFESFFFLSSVSCSIDVTMRSLLHIVVIIDFEGFHSRTEVWFEYREAKKNMLVIIEAMMEFESVCCKWRSNASQAPRDLLYATNLPVFFTTDR